MAALCVCQSCRCRFFPPRLRLLRAPRIPLLPTQPGGARGYQAGLDQREQELHLAIHLTARRCFLIEEVPVAVQCRVAHFASTLALQVIVHEIVRFVSSAQCVDKPGLEGTVPLVHQGSDDGVFCAQLTGCPCPVAAGESRVRQPLNHHACQALGPARNMLDLLPQVSGLPPPVAARLIRLYIEPALALARHLVRCLARLPPLRPRRGRRALAPVTAARVFCVEERAELVEHLEHLHGRDPAQEGEFVEAPCGSHAIGIVGHGILST
eukprot:scaffold71033_cov92-Phaeocystis_antarctica.AAC.4